MDEIGKIKLKKTTNIKDSSNPDPKKTLEEFQNSKAKATYANVEKWYEGLKDHVMPAFLFPLEHDEAEALIANYEHMMIKKKIRELTQNEINILEKLEQKIEECVQKNMPTAKNEGFFVRISTRSAKDGMMFHEKTKNAIKQKVEEWKVTNKSETIPDNDKLSIIFTQFIQQLIVKSGKEAVSVLSHSHRIWQDLIAYREVRGSKSEMSLILRPWTNIPAWGEFRGFVYNRKLVAISSYNRAVHFPHVVEKKNEIEKKIKEYFEIIEPKVIPELKNFICDFAFLDENLEKMVIVELNQYRDYEGNATNAELFDWVKDNEILTGNAPFEFRILEKPLEHETLMRTITAPIKVHLGYMNENEYDYEKDHL